MSTDGMQVQLVVPTSLYTTWAPFAELIITLAHEITAFVHTQVPVKGGGRRNEQKFQEAGFAPERKCFHGHEYIRTALLGKRFPRYDMVFAALHNLSHVMGNEYNLYTSIPNRILLDEPDKINNAFRSPETIQAPPEYQWESTLTASSIVDRLDSAKDFANDPPGDITPLGPSEYTWCKRVEKELYDRLARCTPECKARCREQDEQFMSDVAGSKEKHRSKFPVPKYPIRAPCRCGSMYKPMLNEEQMAKEGTKQYETLKNQTVLQHHIKLAECHGIDMDFDRPKGLFGLNKNTCTKKGEVQARNTCSFQRYVYPRMPGALLAQTNSEDNGEMEDARPVARQRVEQFAPKNIPIKDPIEPEDLLKEAGESIKRDRSNSPRAREGRHFNTARTDITPSIFTPDRVHSAGLELAGEERSKEFLDEPERGIRDDTPELETLDARRTTVHLMEETTAQNKPIPRLKPNRESKEAIGKERMKRIDPHPRAKRMHSDSAHDTPITLVEQPTTHRRQGTHDNEGPHESESSHSWSEQSGGSTDSEAPAPQEEVTIEETTTQTKGVERTRTTSPSVDFAPAEESCTENMYSYTEYSDEEAERDSR